MRHLSDARAKTFKDVTDQLQARNLECKKMRTQIESATRSLYSVHEKSMKVSHNICKLNARLLLTSAIETGTQNGASELLLEEKSEIAQLLTRAPGL